MFIGLRWSGGQVDWLGWFAGNQHIEGLSFLYVLDGLFMRYKREIVAVDLENHVMNGQIRISRRSVGFDDCHVDTLKSEAKVN